MVLGLSLAAFTRLHVVISLIGIVSGLVVMLGLFAGRRLDAVTAVFLVTKLPALHALAPKGNEPPFAVAQLVVLVLFAALTTVAARRVAARGLDAA